MHFFAMRVDLARNTTAHYSPNRGFDGRREHLRRPLPRHHHDQRALAHLREDGTRKRCGNKPGVGRISNITHDNTTATGNSPSVTPTPWGESGGNHISGVTFTDVDINVPGGSAALSTAVPSNDAISYNPTSIGTRPSFGWYLHNADNVHFSDSSVMFASNDDRPAVIVNGGGPVTLHQFTARRGSGSAYDVGLQSVNGYCVSDSTDTGGGVLRVNASGSSTQRC